MLIMLIIIDMWWNKENIINIINDIYSSKIDNLFNI